MKHRIRILCGLLFFTAFGIQAQQAWSPYQRQLWVRTVFIHSEYDSAYLANTKANYDDNIRISTGNIVLEYGITDRLTVDFGTGFGKLGRAKLVDRYGGLMQIPESPDKYGYLDTRIGIRYKILDEFDYDKWWIPTISVRAGAIKKGDYDRNPQSLGDGANGGEADLYLAKDFDFYGLGALGELSYRRRENPVPDDILYYSGLYLRFFESFFFTIGARGQKGQGGYAFADPRQAPPLNYLNLTVPDTIPGVNLYDLWVQKERPAWGRREDYHNVEASLGFTDSYGNFYNLYYSQTYAGYNTAKLQTIGFIVNFPFNL